MPVDEGSGDSALVSSLQCATKQHATGGKQTIGHMTGVCTTCAWHHSAQQRSALTCRTQALPREHAHCGSCQSELGSHLREEVRCQAVLRVVCKLDGFRLGAEPKKRDRRAKRLFPEDLHGVALQPISIKIRATTDPRPQKQHNGVPYMCVKAAFTTQTLPAIRSMRHQGLEIRISPRMSAANADAICHTSPLSDGIRRATEHQSLVSTVSTFMSRVHSVSTVGSKKKPASKSPPAFLPPVATCRHVQDQL